MLAQASAGVYPPDSSVAAAALDCIDRGIVVTDSGARICLARFRARHRDAHVRDRIGESTASTMRQPH
jgi:hypothetical protein